jgi:hypothetical protein
MVFSGTPPETPLRVDQTEQSYTRVSNAAAFTAGQTAIALWTPPSAHWFAVVSIEITVTASGRLQIYYSTNAGANMLYQGTPPIGVFVIQFPKPWPSVTTAFPLNYTTGSGAAGDIVTFGYEHA